MFKEIADRINKIDVFEIVEQIILEIDTIILDINTDEQLFNLGIDSEGDKLIPYSSIEYANFKASLNNAHRGIPDLKVTGDFYGGFFLEIKSGEVRIWSSDSKTGKLVQLYSKDIFGLTEKNWNKVLNEEIAPRLIEIIVNKIAA